MNRSTSHLAHGTTVIFLPIVRLAAVPALDVAHVVLTFVSLAFSFS